MSSNSSFSGEFIQQTTEAVGQFLRWVAELIVSRNWFSLLILVAIAGIFLFNPSSGLAFKFLAIEQLPEGYARGFWLGEAGLFLVALVIAVRTMPRTVPASQADTAERKAIKGLRPFDTGDAEVFAQLQRQRNLRECLESVTSEGFRFGILHGESGCGKTSFLQAGILPQLMVAGDGPVGVYVRFSDQEPVRTIAKAIAERLEIPIDWLLPKASEQVNFTELLVKVTEETGQSLILLLDQFEQFFVHYKRKEQRAPFVQALNGWYHSDQLSPIKIVVSIRSDLMYQLHELHQALQYSLAPQDVFRLEKFTPSEASLVLEAIARTERLEFNRAFVTELARAELGGREDGLISPVDLQILAWMIERQTANELRAFNRSAFEKFGGVEGLLQRFLERSLEARVTDSQRQSVVKVLLALTDMERQVRAGMLTAPELKEKLKGSARPEEIAEAITWLVRGDVRLITPQEKNGEVAYELAHERLIPALMRQAGKELSAVDQANQLLNRRVNEWLGNRCDQRYCFGLRELWLLRQQQPYLVWGAKREQKGKLLRLSQRRVYGGIAAILVAVVIASGFASWWNLTPGGQIQKMQWQLSRLLKKNSSADIGTEAAIAFAKNDQWDKAVGIKGKNTSAFIQESADFLVRATSVEDENKNELLTRLEIQANSLESNSSKSEALREIATAAGELDNSEQAEAMLRDALAAATAIEDDFSKSNALRAIASAYGDLDDSGQAEAVLRDALAAAIAIEDDSSKSYALRAIASAAGDLDDSEQAEAVLRDALAAATAIKDDDNSKLYTLRAIASAYGELDDSEQAEAVLRDALAAATAIENNYSKSDALSAIASAYGELDDSEQAEAVLRDALAAATAIEDDSSKSYALRAIASAAGDLDDSEQAEAVLRDALAAATAIENNDSSKSYALSAIASAYGDLDDSDQAEAVLRDALAAATAIEDDSSKSYALRAIASAYGELDDSEQAEAVLRDALAAATAIENDYYSKSDALSAIASAAGELDDSEQAEAVLRDALAAATAIEDDSYKSYALSAIASAAGELDDSSQAKAMLSEALSAANTIGSDSYKSDVMRAIVNAGVAITDNDVVKVFLGEVLQSAHQEKISVPMVEVATYYAKQANWFQVLHALSQAETREKTVGLSRALTILAEHNQPSLIRGAVVLPTPPHGIDFLGQPNNYALKVRLQSPDTSCDQRADWWEVVTPEGQLLARKLINTVHTDEQPFFNTLPSVDIEPDQKVLIRAHFQGEYFSGPDLLMDERIRNINYNYYNSKFGYTDQALEGSIKEGFKVVRISENFASWLEEADPLPDPDACSVSES